MEIVGDDDAPSEHVPKAPKGKSKEKMPAAVEDVIQRQSQRLKALVANPPNKSTSSLASGSTSSKKRKASSGGGGGGGGGGGRGSRGGKKAKTTAEVATPKTLGSMAREMESKLSHSQREAVQSIMKVMDRTDDTRLWETEDGRLRCWMDVADRMIERATFISTFEDNGNTTTASDA